MFILSCNKDENPQPIQTQGYNMLLIGNSFFKPYADHLSSLATEANLNEHISAVVKEVGNLEDQLIYGTTQILKNINSLNPHWIRVT